MAHITPARIALIQSRLRAEYSPSSLPLLREFYIYDRQGPKDDDWRFYLSLNPDFSSEWRAERWGFNGVRHTWIDCRPSFTQLLVTLTFGA